MATAGRLESDRHARALVDGHLETLCSGDRPGPPGKTFARNLRYSPAAVGRRTVLRVDDDVRFDGFAKLAAIVARDIKHRWRSSVEKLKTTAEGQ